MELETRECPCGMKFKCLPKSPQKFHANNCQVKFEKTSFGWTQIAIRNRRKQALQDIKTHITSAIMPDLNVKQIPIGLKNIENISESTNEENERKTQKNTEKTTENTKLITGRNDVTNQDDSEEAPLMPNIESDDESDLENLDDYSPINTEKPSRIGMLNTIRQQKSMQRQGISEREFQHSKSLVDESIGQLQELTKLCVSSLHSQEAKHRDPQMVNSAVNSAKAITELLRLKLNAAKLFKS